MKKIIKAFTLIELIVGITISMILMVSVGIFVSSGMQNILLQQKVLENTSEFTDFANNLHTSFNLIQSGSIIEKTASGVIFKRGQNFGEGGFSYIGTETLSGIYCESGSEDMVTNSVFLKNFIPFEENGEDIFNQLMGGYTGTLTSKEINISGNKYISYQKEHIVTKNGINIIGKGIFGDKFEEGVPGIDIYLNSPTGLVSDGTNLYISDTLNNRILYLDSSDNIHLLLDESDGLNEPTGLYFENNSLYIANSGNGEILKYSSVSETEGILTLTGITENNITNFEIEFFDNNGNTQNITGPTESNISVPGSSNDFSEINSNIIKYYFINYTGTNIAIPDCNGESGNEILSGGNPVYCTASGTGQLSTSVNTTFNNSTIIVNNINNLSNIGSYYIDLKLNGVHKDYFSYFTKSDNDLTTKNDNILTVHIPDLKYPTGIWGITTSDYNEFGKISRTYSDIPYHITDTLLGTPVSNLSISNTTNDLLSLVLKYYKSYNCYNLDQKTERTFILNKNLK